MSIQLGANETCWRRAKIKNKRYSRICFAKLKSIKKNGTSITIYIYYYKLWHPSKYLYILYILPSKKFVPLNCM